MTTTAPVSVEIASRLREARTILGISARELDRRASLAEGHTSLIENRRRNVEAATAAKLAVALGVTLDWLVLGIGQGPVAPTPTDIESS